MSTNEVVETEIFKMTRSANHILRVHAAIDYTFSIDKKKWKKSRIKKISNFSVQNALKFT